MTPRYTYKGVVYKLAGLVKKLGYTRYGLMVAIKKGYQVDGAVITRDNVFNNSPERSGGRNE